jgi:Uma2 family endonuclease
MNVARLRRMTADEYASWSQQQATARYELIDGQVVQMNAERMGHMRAKSRIANALQNALSGSVFEGETCWDGMAVKIDAHTVHEPDAMLRLGTRLSDDEIFVTDPVVVVDVLSPSTGPIDSGRKLTNYFLLDSVQHYLVVDTVKRLVLHYVRGGDGAPIMRPPVSAGAVQLDPPGLSISIAEIFE